jgi:hypothetical protein
MDLPRCLYGSRPIAATYRQRARPPHEWLGQARASGARGLAVCGYLDEHGVDRHLRHLLEQLLLVSLPQIGQRHQSQPLTAVTSARA